jgi:outer membrane protein insertion porin family
MKKLLPFLLVGSALFASDVVQSIKYENLTKLSSATANELVELEIGTKLDIKKVNQSIKSLFRQGYFEDIQVLNDNGNITFKFVEKKLIASVSIEGYKEAEDEKMIQQFLGINKGDIFTQKKIDKAKQRIIDELQQKGKIDSQVEVKIDEFNEKSVALKFLVNEGEEIIIKELNLVGAKELDASDFDEYIGNKAEEFMGWMFGRNDGKARITELAYDNDRIKNVYMKNGYIDAEVSEALMEVDFSKYEAILTYDIKEGNQYTVKAVNLDIDNQVIEKDKLKEDLKLQVSKIYNGDKMREDMQTITSRIKDQGYAFATVFPDFVRVSETEVEVNYTINSGEKVYVNDIIISGNTRTIDRVIRRDVFLAPGDMYKLTELEESRKALKRTGYFDDVQIIEKKRYDLGNKIDLIVKVTEAKTGAITLGGGYGSASGFSVNTSISDKNIFGSGIELRAEIDTSSDDKTFNVSISNPRVNDSIYSLNANASLRNYESSTYDSTTRTAGVGVGRKLNRYLSASLNYNYKSVDVDDEVIEDNINETANYTKGSIIPTLSFNNTDSYLLPREGIKAYTSLEYAGAGGDLSFWKSYTNFNIYYGLEELIDFDLIARYKARLGYILEDKKTPSNERFTLGGMTTVRGYNSGSIYPVSDIDANGYYTTTGGTATFVNSVELSLPLTKSDKVRVTAFYDYGMLGEDSFSDFQRSSVGISFDWISPIGPIQFIFPKALGVKEGDETTNFEFALGRFF